MSRNREGIRLIVKKKGGHGAGHHGSAWKVACADFVTAMMAFFMVMWMIDAGSGDTFFALGSEAPQPAAEHALRIIGEELSALANDLVIEGHTDARPFGREGIYSNWELSTGRANSARRVLTRSGIAPTRRGESARSRQSPRLDPAPVLRDGHDDRESARITERFVASECARRSC